MKGEDLREFEYFLVRNKNLVKVGKQDLLSGVCKTGGFEDVRKRFFEFGR
jgi:hypothetical protein